MPDMFVWVPWPEDPDPPGCRPRRPCGRRPGPDGPSRTGSPASPPGRRQRPARPHPFSTQQQGDIALTSRPDRPLTVGTVQDADPPLLPDELTRNPAAVIKYTRRHYLTRKGAEHHAATLRDVGATVIVTPSDPVTWPQGEQG